MRKTAKLKSFLGYHGRFKVELDELEKFFWWLSVEFLSGFVHCMMQSSSQSWNVRGTCLETARAVGAVVGGHDDSLDIGNVFGSLLLFLVMLFSNS